MSPALLWLAALCVGLLDTSLVQYSHFLYKANTHTICSQIVCAFALLGKMRTSDGMTSLTTWTNSWATSHRSHDPGGKLPCLLGRRDQQDSLMHYLHCPHMYSLMKFFNRSTDCNPLIRFGLVEPSLDCFSRICMASAGYHAVRRNVRKTSFKLVDMDLSSSDVRRFWTVFAEAYAADAREHNAPGARSRVARIESLGSQIGDRPIRRLRGRWVA